MAVEKDIVEIEMILSGDDKAYSSLVHRYKDFVFTVVLRMIKNREDAEELTQDVFVKAFEKLSTYRGDSKFSTWLYTIAYRKALDKIKGNIKNISLDDIDSIDKDDFISFKDGLSFLEEKEREILIKNSIDELPPIMASVIMFYYYEELSIKEIAEITQLSNENVRIKLFRGRKKLFNILQDQLLLEII